MKRIVMGGILCCLFVFFIAGLCAAYTVNYRDSVSYYGYIESIEDIAVGSETFDVVFKYDSFSGALGSTVLTSANAAGFVTVLLDALNDQEMTSVVGTDPDNRNGSGYFGSGSIYLPYGNWYQGGYYADPKDNMEYVIDSLDTWVMYGPGSFSGSLETQEVMWASVTKNSNPVPEPASMLLFGAGLICLAGFRRKFSKN